VYDVQPEMTIAMSSEQGYPRTKMPPETDSLHKKTADGDTKKVVTGKRKRKTRRRRKRRQTIKKTERMN